MISYGVHAAMTGDGSACPLIGSTNVQGRLINGSSNPADDPPTSNTGFFFHIEQSNSIRRSLDGYAPIIRAFGDLIPNENPNSHLPELPDLVFNEIHAHPTADANNNGSVQTVSDEFVEIVNTGSDPLNISDWIFSDSGQDRHVINSKTTLLPNQPLVIFGGDTPTGDFGGAEVQVASSGSMSLSNSGENIYFKTSAQDTILHIDFPGGFTGESINLTPDLIGSTYVAHSSADTVDHSVFSPGADIFGNPFFSNQVSTEDNERVLGFVLYQNYPNPFNPNTTIKYDLPVAGIVKLEVIDILGRHVSTLVNKFEHSGSKTVNFDGSYLSSGIYFYVLESDFGLKTGKMILLK